MTPLERIAKALFDRHQNSLFPPRYTNIVLYGQPQVTWEFVRSEQFVHDDAADVYFEQARTVLRALLDPDDGVADAMTRAADDLHSGCAPQVESATELHRRMFTAAINHILGSAT